MYKRQVLERNLIPFAVLAPKQLKLLACSNGNASKEAVLAAAIRQLDYDGDSTDEADALWLLEAALQRYGLEGRLEGLGEKRLAALEKVEWPSLIMNPQEES